MTTILYVKNDGLYADSKQVEVIGERQFIHIANKIITNKEKTFAYAVTGELLAVNTISLEPLIDKILKRSTIGSRFELKDIINAEWLDGSMLIITACSAVLIEEGEKYMVYRLDNMDYYGIGTGGPIAEAFMRLTADAKESVQKAVIFDLLSDGPITKQCVSELKYCPEYDPNKRINEV